MDYPIVKVTTSDGIQLFGFYTKVSTDTVLINIHGTASSFYVEEFESYFVKSLPQVNCALLFTNNRGNFVMESWQKTGAAQEKFEDCVHDIDAWISYALSLGYSRIILSGHSLGTEKIVYYMSKGKYADKVIGVVLLGFADSFGTQMEFLKTQSIDPMIEAKQLMSQGKGYQFLSSIWLSHAGVLPQNAESYVNFFSENSELSKALPLRKGKDLEMYRNIKVPILGIVGDHGEFTVIPLEQAIALLRSENAHAEVHQIRNCDHCYVDHQQEMVEIVSEFVKRIST